MASKKSSVAPILIGGGLIAVLLMGGKKKASASTGGTGGGGTLPGPEPDVDVGKDDNSKPSGGGGGGGGGKPSGGTSQITAKEKQYVDFYYNLGLYKLPQIDMKTFGMPAQYADLAKKGTKTDAQWLANMAYWALYSAPGNESGTTAPWKITGPGEWAKVWSRINAYAETLKF